MPQIAVKEERRVLVYASDGLNGKVRDLAAAQRLFLLVAKELGDRLGNAFTREAVVCEDLG